MDYQTSETRQVPLVIFPSVNDVSPEPSIEKLLEESNSRLKEASDFQDSVLVIKQLWYETTIHAGSGIELISDPWRLSLDTLYQELIQHKSATYCSGHADGLVKLFAWYGIESYPVNYGLLNNLGDLTGDAATVVVGRQNQLYLVSAMFNTALVKGGEELCPLSEYYRLVKEEKLDSVWFSANTSNGQYLTTSRSVLTKANLYKWNLKSQISKSNFKGHFLVNAPRDLGQYLAGGYKKDFMRIHESWSEKLKQSGYKIRFQDEADAILLPMYLEGVYHNSDTRFSRHQEVMNLIQRARGY